MYLHLGGDVLINKDDLVAIINLETATKGKITDSFLKKIEINKTVNYISEICKEKSLIITTKHHYISPISSKTLLKRFYFDITKDN